MTLNGVFVVTRFILHQLSRENQITVEPRYNEVGYNKILL